MKNTKSLDMHLQALVLEYGARLVADRHLLLQEGLCAADDRMNDLRRDIRGCDFHVSTIKGTNTIRLRTSPIDSAACEVDVSADKGFVYRRRVIPEAKNAGNRALLNDVVEAVERRETEIETLLTYLNKTIGMFTDRKKSLGDLFTNMDAIDVEVRRYTSA